MAAIGTMTATAMTPPEDNPLDFDEVSAPTVASADDLVDEAVLEEATEYEYAELGERFCEAVEVMNIVVGEAVPPATDGVWVTTEV